MANSSVQDGEYQNRFSSLVLKANLAGFSPLCLTVFAYSFMGHSISMWMGLMSLILSRGLTEWILWAKSFPKLKMNNSLSAWDSFLSNTPALKAGFDMIIDLAADAVLIGFASRITDSLGPILLVYMGNQLLGIFLHGLVRNKMGSAGIRLAGMACTYLAVFSMLEISGVISSSGYAKIFGLLSMDKSHAAFMVVTGKCMLSLVTRNARYVISRALG